MVITRQISLAHVVDFGRNVAAALTSAGVPAAEQLAVCEAHVTAKCPLCKTAVNGRTLAAALLTGAATQATGVAAASRLRLGYCLRRGCPSAFYEFECASHPTIDWAQIPVASTLAASPRESGVSVASAVAQTAALKLKGLANAAALKLKHLANTAASMVKRQLTWRTAAALAVLLALWMSHQWVTGGRIPLIREPKSYATQLPAGAELLPPADD